MGLLLLQSMYKLDLKDRKILYELDLNCRQSNAQIGKKVGLGRDVVAYRINRMQEEGIIKNYYALIDTFKLGYHMFRIYINFQYVTSKIKEEIIQYFVDNKDSLAVFSLKNEIDLDVVVWINDIFKFYQFWEKTLDLYENYFSKYAISILTKGIVYKKSFLLDNNEIKHDNVLCYMNCGGKPVDIDEMDYRLLNELAVNGRIPLIDLAEKLGYSSQAVNYRIKNLLNNGIIKAFRVNLDLQKLNLLHHKVDIYLKDHKKKKQILDYLQDKPYIEYMNLALGWADLEPEFIVKDFNDLLKILDDINNKFGDVIKKQIFWVVEKMHKLNFLPEFSNTY